MSRASPGSSYFDVHAALAEDTLMPVRLLRGARGGAPALDPATGTPDLAPNAQRDMPLWCLPPLFHSAYAEAR